MSDPDLIIELEEELVADITNAEPSFSLELGAPQGPPGPAGPQGPQGPQGPVGPSGGSPGGLDTQFQFNDLGAFGGAAGLTYDKVTKTITFANGATNTLLIGKADGTYNIISFNGVLNSSTGIMIEGGGGTDKTLYLNSPTGGQIDLQIGAGTKFRVTAASIYPAGATVSVGDAAAGHRWSQAFLGGQTVTANTPVLDITQTWNNGLVDFTGILANFTSTAYGAATKLMDLQVGGVSQFSVGPQFTSVNGGNGGETSLYVYTNEPTGNAAVFKVRPPAGGGTAGGIGKAFQIINAGSGSGWASFEYQNGFPGLFLGDGVNGRDTGISRAAAATIQIGFPDAYGGLQAQTLQAQSVAAGTLDTAGVDWSFVGSKGTGTGAGGNLLFKTAPAGTTGSAQNAAVERMRIKNNGDVAIGDGSTSIGRLLVNNLTDINLDSFPTRFQMVFNPNTDWAATYLGYFNTPSAPAMAFGKSRGASFGVHGDVVVGDRIGQFWYYGSKDGGWRNSAELDIVVFETGLNYVSSFFRFYGGSSGGGKSAVMEAFGAGVTIGAGFGTIPARKLVVWDHNTNTNIVTYPARLVVTTNGTPANGIGTGLEFVTRTSANNDEIGATIEAVVTDVTATAENFDLLFKTMGAGTAATEKMRITNDGRVVINYGGDEGTAALANSRLAIAQDGASAKMMRFAGYGNQAFNSGQVATTTRGAGPDTQGIVAANDQLYGLDIIASDGANFKEAAFIGAYVDGTPAVNSVPGRISFWTTAAGSAFSSERMRINSAGSVLINQTTPLNVDASKPFLGIATDPNNSEYPFVLSTYGNHAFGGSFVWSKTRNASPTAHTAVLADDAIGRLRFAASDGVNFIRAVEIDAEVDGAPGLNSMPGRIVFKTTPSGTSSVVERMRISSNGAVGINHNNTSFLGYPTLLTIAADPNAVWTARFAGKGGAAYNIFTATLNADPDGQTSMGNSNALAYIQFYGSDGTSFQRGGQIIARVDAVPTTGHMPTRLEFYTRDATSISDAERMRIDKDGLVYIGPLANGTFSSGGRINIAVDTTVVDAANFLAYGNQYGPNVNLQSTRGATPNVNTIVLNNDGLGYLNFAGANGVASYKRGAMISAEVEGTPSSTSVPGRLIFATTASGNGDVTERMRIASYGGVGIGSGAQTTGLLHVAHSAAVSSAVAGGNQAGLEVFVYDTGSGGVNLNHYLNLVNYNNDGYGDAFNIKYSRGSAAAASIVQNGDSLGFITFWGGAGAGNGFTRAADIHAEVDGTPGIANDMPGRLMFRTTPDGSGTLAERLRIDSAGRVVVGGVAAFQHVWWGNIPKLQIFTDSAGAPLGLSRFTNDATGAEVYLTKSRGTTPGTNTALVSGDSISYIAFVGADGIALERAADITVKVDGTPTANTSVPGRIMFGTAPAGSADTVERLRIDSAGHVIIGGVASQAVPNQSALQIHGTTFDTAGATFARWANTAASVASLNLLKSRGATVGTHGAVAAGDNAARISAYFDDGTSYLEAARIDFDVDGTPGLNDIPSAIKFYTALDGGTTIAERLRITNAGAIQAPAGGINGQSVNIKSLTESTTIAAAATTDTAIQIPANAIVLAVTVRVTTVIPTATTFTVTGAGSATVFNTAAVSTAAGSTDPGTKAGAFFNATAQAIRFTPNSTPATATGVVRVTIYYIDVTPPTS